MRLMPPKVEHKRARVAQTTALVKWALLQDERRWKLWVGVTAMAYVYGFRIPSETFKQWGAGDAPAFFHSTFGDGGEIIAKY